MADLNAWVADQRKASSTRSVPVEQPHADALVVDAVAAEDCANSDDDDALRVHAEEQRRHHLESELKASEAALEASRAAAAVLAAQVAAASQREEAVEDAFTCPICKRLLTRPVVSACGAHAFCAARGEALVLNAGIAAAIEANDGPSWRKRESTRAFIKLLRSKDFVGALAVLETLKDQPLEDFVDPAGEQHTPLLWACASASQCPPVPGASAVALLLIACNADVTACTKSGLGPLSLAERDDDLLAALLDKGASEPTALEVLACSYCDETGSAVPAREAILLRGIANGDLAHLADDAKAAALLECCRNGYDGPAAALIAASADCTATSLTTLLHRAALTGALLTTTALLDLGANVNALNDLKQSALHIACAYKREAVALLLVARVATRGTIDDMGRYAYHYANGAGMSAAAIAAVKPSE